MLSGILSRKTFNKGTISTLQYLHHPQHITAARRLLPLHYRLPLLHMLYLVQATPSDALVRPLPLAQVLRIATVLVSLVRRLLLLVLELLPRTSASIPKVWNVINGVHGQAEPVRLVADGKL